MKPKHIIILLTIALIVAFALKARSQPLPRTVSSTTMYHSYNAPKDNLYWQDHLIADETYLTYDKTGAKIETFSELIFQKISLKWGAEFKSIDIKHRLFKPDKPRKWIIYLSESTPKNLQQWAKKNL